MRQTTKRRWWWWWWWRRGWGRPEYPTNPKATMHGSANQCLTSQPCSLPSYAYRLDVRRQLFQMHIHIGAPALRAPLRPMRPRTGGVQHRMSRCVACVRAAVRVVVGAGEVRVGGLAGAVVDQHLHLQHTNKRWQGRASHNRERGWCGGLSCTS